MQFHLFCSLPIAAHLFEGFNSKLNFEMKLKLVKKVKKAHLILVCLSSNSLQIRFVAHNMRHIHKVILKPRPRSKPPLSANGTRISMKILSTYGRRFLSM